MKMLSPRRSATTARLTERSVLSILVCVWLVQIPVPVLHDHASFGSGHALTQHVDRHHCESETEGCELHWHFMLPRELNHEDEEESSDAQTQAAISQILAGVISVGVGDPLDHWVPSRSVAVEGNREAVGVRPKIRSPLSLFSLTPAVRSCALLCVMRC